MFQKKFKSQETSNRYQICRWRCDDQSESMDVTGLLAWGSGKFLSLEPLPRWLLKKTRHSNAVQVKLKHPGVKLVSTLKLIVAICPHFANSWPIRYQLRSLHYPRLHLILSPVTIHPKLWYTVHNHDNTTCNA